MPKMKHAGFDRERYTGQLVKAAREADDARLIALIVARSRPNKKNLSAARHALYRAEEMNRRLVEAEGYYAREALRLLEAKVRDRALKRYAREHKRRVK